VFDKKYMKSDDLHLLNDHINVDDVVLLYLLHDYDIYQIQHVYSTFEVHQEEDKIYSNIFLFNYK
jgi:hypothetical protein